MAGIFFNIYVILFRSIRYRKDYFSASLSLPNRFYWNKITPRTYNVRILYGAIKRRRVDYLATSNTFHIAKHVWIQRRHHFSKRMLCTFLYMNLHFIFILTIQHFDVLNGQRKYVFKSCLCISHGIALHIDLTLYLLH